MAMDKLNLYLKGPGLDATLYPLFRIRSHPLHPESQRRPNAKPKYICIFYIGVKTPMNRKVAKLSEIAPKF